MADTKLTGINWLLFIDTAGGTSYDTVVCLTDNSIKMATDVIDAASKCGPDKAPGMQTVTIDLSGVSLYDPSGGTISEADLADVWKNKTTIGWKIGKASPVTGNVTYTGTGFLSDLEVKGGDKDVVNFTGTLQTNGLPTITVTP